MQRGRSQFFDGCPHDRSRAPEFHFGIIYDSAEKGDQAMRVCQRIIAHLNDSFLFHVELCPLAAFEGRPDPAEIQASSACLIILATESFPPPRFWTWLDAWAIGSSRPSLAIGAITTHQGTAIRERLQRLCQSRNVDLITWGELGEGLFLPEGEIGLQQHPQIAAFAFHLETTKPLRSARSFPRF